MYHAGDEVSQVVVDNLTVLQRLVASLYVMIEGTRRSDIAGEESKAVSVRLVYVIFLNDLIQA